MNKFSKPYLGIEISSIETFSNSSHVDGRINEDSMFVLHSPGYLNTVVAAVIDGAGTRLPFQKLLKVIKSQSPKLTPSAFASHFLKTYLVRLFQEEPNIALQDALILANKALYQEIQTQVNGFELSELLIETTTPWKNDFRSVRMFLPACTITLIRLNIASGMLEFANLGDSSLIEIQKNNLTIRHTRDQMGKFDRIAFKKIIDWQNKKGYNDFKEAVSTPGGRHFIIESGIHLNYIDEQGNTNLNLGCGVINGLEEVVDYIELGCLELDTTQTKGIALLTDGMELLRPLNESSTQKKKRIALTGTYLQGGGLRKLYKEMSTMAQRDSSFNAYPRTKIQDDATGIYIHF